jgi:asparagine synthase (glutamine-hydrolysing)
VVSFEAAAEEIARLVDRAVAEKVIGEPKVAVAFSGGLDSSMITKCAAGYSNVVTCTAFVRRAGDDVRAGSAAEALGVEHVSTELTAENVGAALTELRLPFVPTLMDRSLWCLYRVVARSAHDAGARVLLLGQLADELFGGYAKYSRALSVGGEEAARRMMSLDLQGYALRGRVRDVGACAPWVEPRFPFETKALVEAASRLPVSYKLRQGVSKAVLRRAAAMVGVPEGIAGLAKKAAQYSSGVQKLVAGLPF